jgi:putative sterol carrier protein
VMQAGKNRHAHICESISLFGSEVLPSFAARADEVEAAKGARLAEACSRALARRAPARTMEDEDYVISPGDEPRPAYGASGGGMHVEGSLAERARAVAESAFGSFVSGRSDEQLDTLMGAGPGLRLLFKAMETSFDPESTRGFSGTIQYSLRSSRGPRPWNVTVSSSGAVAAPGEAESPAVTLHADVPVFVRIAAGQLDPARAMLEGKLDVDGDLAVASRLGEMFGGAPRF